MIENLKKYLVMGTFKTVNWSRHPDPNWKSTVIGPFVEEVWAEDEKMAKTEWLRKVLPMETYYQEYEVEVQLLYGINFFRKNIFRIDD